MPEIAKALVLETFGSNEMVFDFEDIGDKFYIILQGSVDVSVPMSVKVTDQEQAERKKAHRSLSLKLEDLNERIFALKRRVQNFTTISTKYDLLTDDHSTHSSCSREECQEDPEINDKRDSSVFEL